MATARKGNRKMKWTPELIKSLRDDGYGETQREFCERLGVGLGTLRHWEQGQGKPIGPAQLLLDRLKEDLESGRFVPNKAAAVA